MASIFNFLTKEGKHFAPITQNKTQYRIDQAGAFVENGSRPVSGVKGVFAKVRIQLTDTARANKAELFAVNTESFASSN